MGDTKKVAGGPEQPEQPTEQHPERPARHDVGDIPPERPAPDAGPDRPADGLTGDQRKKVREALTEVEELHRLIAEKEGAAIHEWRKIGDRLKKLKEDCKDTIGKHGNWQPFLVASLPFSYRKAAQSVQIAKKWDHIEAHMTKAGIKTLTIEQAMDVPGVKRSRSEGESDPEKAKAKSERKALADWARLRQPITDALAAAGIDYPTDDAVKLLEALHLSSRTVLRAFQTAKVIVPKFDDLPPAAVPVIPRKPAVAEAAARVKPYAEMSEAEKREFHAAGQRRPAAKKAARKPAGKKRAAARRSVG